MQLYNCKVRLDGSVLNEVRKEDVTAAEVEVLRAIHGADAVVDIVITRMDKRSHAEERQRLNDAYASPRDFVDEKLQKRVELMRNLFGHPSANLPVRLEGEFPAASEAPQRVDVEDELAEQAADPLA